MSKLLPENLPRHVAVIMDGNGRWAGQRGLARNEGHRQGVEAVRATVEAATQAGIQYLSLFAFSEENWKRPVEETATLMSLMIEAIYQQTPVLMQNNIKCLFIGNMQNIPAPVRERMESCLQQTAGNTQMTLIVAISYSGKWDILQAVNACMRDKKGSADPLTAQEFAGYLSTSAIPDPDLLIRTSGEERISNFMLWQLAYTELYFTPVLWPDFRKLDFQAALEAYSNRKRRFGKTTEQL